MSENDNRTEDKAEAIAEESADPVAEADVVEERTPLPLAPPPRRGGGGFAGGLLGGVLAVAAGIGLTQFIPGLLPAPDNSAIEALVAQQAQEIEKLKADLGTLAARPVIDPTAELATLRAGLEEKLAESSAAADPSAAIAKATEGLQATVSALDGRLSEVEKRPTGPDSGPSATALAAYERDLQALRDQVAAQGGTNAAAQTQIENAMAEARAELTSATEAAQQAGVAAASAARKVSTDAAVNRIAAAIEAGGPFASAVAELTEAGLTVPPEVTDHAQSGLPTLTDLQRRFPDTARAALDAALRGSVGESWTDRVSAFLRTQTGARSLQPREGNDPDAILSRAEAATESGDLATALTEIATLPEAAQPAMAAWVTDAQARIAAGEALTKLASAVDAQ